MYSMGMSIVERECYGMATDRNITAEWHCLFCMVALLVSFPAYCVLEGLPVKIVG